MKSKETKETKKMKRIYNLLADMVITRIEAEKETTLSEDTHKMLYLLQGLYDQLIPHVEENTLKDYERIAAETYEDDPQMIAGVTTDDVTPVDEYRVRVIPAKDNRV